MKSKNLSPNSHIDLNAIVTSELNLNNNRKPRTLFTMTLHTDKSPKTSYDVQHLYRIAFHVLKLQQKSTYRNPESCRVSAERLGTRSSYDGGPGF